MTRADPPIEYIRRTRAYYLALGYGNPYQWAHFDEVPFQRPAGALAQARVGIVTTAAPYKPKAGDQSPGAPYNAEAKFYEVYSGPTDQIPDLRISHIAIDRDHTTAEDIGSYFPLAALKRAEAESLVGEAAIRFYGLPTNRSQETTLNTDVPELVHRCLEDQWDAAILVPNCPVCHQSVALAARELESAGIATVIMGCALDIVEHVGVPRFLFSDFPLGNSAGLPGHIASQDDTLRMALDLLERAEGPRTTQRSPIRWPGPADWKESYSNPARLTPEEIARRRAAFDAGKAAAKAVREA